MKSVLIGSSILRTSSLTSSTSSLLVVQGGSFVPSITKSKILRRSFVSSSIVVVPPPQPTTTRLLYNNNNFDKLQQQKPQYPTTFWSLFVQQQQQQRTFASNCSTNPISTRRQKFQRTSSLSLFGTTLRAMSSASSSSKRYGTNVEWAIKALQDADCICFDVDCTVVQEDGIDVVAEYLQKGPEVAQLTKAAMEGGLKIEQALEQRLNLLQPSQQQLERCLEIHPCQFTPGVEEFISALHATKKHVYLVSGGLRIMIEPIAEKLNIHPTGNVVANTIFFDADGFYNGFDTTEPTSRDQGKAVAVQSLIDKYNYTTVVMIGDGMTDSQAKPPATTFIGFGGVIIRPPVQAVADWYVTNFKDLQQVLVK